MIKKGLRTRFIPRTLAAWLLLVTPTAGMAMTPLRLDFDGDAVVVSDLEPGAEIVYFSVSRSVVTFVPRTEARTDLHVDDDKDGEIRIPLERIVPPKFLAAAVELASGRFGLLTPEGSSVREIAFPADSFGQEPGRRYDQLEDHSDLGVMLLVRPGVGAWSITTGDGAPSDESPPSDGLVRTSASAMQPVGESGPPPDEYQKDDILIRVAPRAGLQYYATRVVR
jgi:hypothetical protein